MQYIKDKIEAVVDLMRPINISYGQAMLDFMEADARRTDLTQAPFFMAGHRIEIANRLLDKDDSKARKFLKYPLIALFLDTDADESGGMHVHKLNLAIIMLTDENLNAEERIERVFKPVLGPIYDRFIVELGNGPFSWEGNQKIPPHKPILRPYWGTQFKEYAVSQNEKNILNDPIDAIEILGLELRTEDICI